LPGVVSELCALQGIPLGDDDVDTVSAIFAEYLQDVAILETVALDPEAEPPLRLVISQRLADVTPADSHANDDTPSDPARVPDQP
jgi:hypothetical protein